ncbi:MAG: DUF6455 family protein [Geminicoccaceae bacterium]
MGRPSRTANLACSLRGAGRRISLQIVNATMRWSSEYRTSPEQEMTRKHKELPVHLDRAIRADFMRRIRTHAVLLERMVDAYDIGHAMTDRVSLDYVNLLENCLACERPDECRELQKDMKRNLDKIESFCSNFYYFHRLK